MTRKTVTKPSLPVIKLLSLDPLIAGLMHEINTPMGAIHSNNDVLSRAVGKMRRLTPVGAVTTGMRRDPELDRFLAILEEVCRNNTLAIERIMGIVRNLKNFARLDEAKRKKVDIHEGLE